MVNLGGMERRTHFSSSFDQPGNDSSLSMPASDGSDFLSISECAELMV